MSKALEAGSEVTLADPSILPEAPLEPKGVVRIIEHIAPLHAEHPNEFELQLYQKKMADRKVTVQFGEQVVITKAGNLKIET